MAFQLKCSSIGLILVLIAVFFTTSSWIGGRSAREGFAEEELDSHWITHRICVRQGAVKGFDADDSVQSLTKPEGTPQLIENNATDLPGVRTVNHDAAAPALASTPRKLDENNHKYRSSRKQAELCSNRIQNGTLRWNGKAEEIINSIFDRMQFPPTNCEEVKVLGVEMDVSGERKVCRRIGVLERYLCMVIV